MKCPPLGQLLIVVPTFQSDVPTTQANVGTYKKPLLQAKWAQFTAASLNLTRTYLKEVTLFFFVHSFLLRVRVKLKDEPLHEIEGKFMALSQGQSWKANICNMFSSPEEKGTTQGGTHQF